ncbi:ATPase family AAA domain-containing protein 3B 1 [Phlyctema vagabunda]|uniref:ATPase family AAA domain-containing protein 3B 1 n=1 Tax=Phlyctema vagabunda TaxID=108571 RepID=A0ABR4PDJ0_9HELO
MNQASVQTVEDDVITIESPSSTQKVQDPISGADNDSKSVNSDAETSTELLDSVSHPGVRYRVDWVTDEDEVVYQKEVSGLHVDINSILEQGASHSKIFDVVTKYEVAKGMRRNKDSGGEISMQDLALRTKSRPSVSIHIFSKAIINALRSVVDYYPEYDLYQEPCIISEPYAILVHHREQLAEFGEKCRQAKQEDLCVRERLAYEHLKLLQEFLNSTIMPVVNAELERNKRGYQTWDMLWLSHRPGDFITSYYFGNTDERVGKVLYKLENGAFNNEGLSWDFTYWSLKHDGEKIGRSLSTMRYDRFDGEEKRDAPSISVAKREKRIDVERKGTAELVARGKQYYSLVRSAVCQHYKGRTAKFPHREVEGLVMVDMKAFYAHAGDSLAPPDLMGTTKDMDTWVSDCLCKVCNSRRENGEMLRGKAEFAKFHETFPQDWEELGDDMYYLLPANIPAYVFKTRHWELLQVEDFSEAVFDQTMIDKLVMDEARLTMIKSLAASYIRQNKLGQISKQPAWQADFVEGKGKGQIFLLHGKPGVGKTYTAECIASYTKSPLMILNASDIGSDPRNVEGILTDNFKRAKKWNAVLLIDEADVFMERRSTNDLERNSLVAGFLRSLEYYDGILFLTTNRIGHFDDAFTSRIHHKFRYPDFTDEDRKKIWKSFMDKLDKERGGYIRLGIDAREYLESSKEIEQVKWNGREIRNGFQTAVALAEYDAEKDAEGTIVIKVKHISSVVKMSIDFQDYLEELHSANEDTRAAKARDR